MSINWFNETFPVNNINEKCIDKLWINFDFFTYLIRKNWMQMHVRVFEQSRYERNFLILSVIKAMGTKKRISLNGFWYETRWKMKKCFHISIRQKRTKWQMTYINPSKSVTRKLPRNSPFPEKDSHDPTRDRKRMINSRL